MSKEHLVVGPPGTGKTTFLSRQATRAAEEVGPEAVMIASLTRAAAHEIAGRDTPIPKRCIGTLHAHAYRALDRPELAETPDGIESWNSFAERAGLVWKINPGSTGKDLDWPPEQAGSGQGDSLLAALGTLRAKLAPEELWPPKVQRFSREWERWKKETNRLDFTDLIEHAIEEASRPPTIPKIMMLDEAQDLSALEFKLARMWGNTCEQIVIVGDPDQCLYAWRGTDPDSMLSGEHASFTVLEQSYRVPAAVHDYAVNWIEQIDGREPIDYKPRLTHEGGDPVQGEVRRLPGNWRDPEGIVKRALADVEEGQTGMILASCGYMLEPTVAVLKRHGLPFWNPYRVTHGGWNPLRGARRMLAFLRPDVATWGDEARMWTWKDVHAWAQNLEAKDVFARGAKTFIEQKAGEDPEKEDEEDESASWSTLQSLFKSEEILDRIYEMDVEWWQVHLLKKAQKSTLYPLEVYKSRGGAALRERPKLIVGTIHSVKGGEADSVYVYPDLSHRGWAAAWDRPSSRNPTYRLFYVAFTRARERLSLCEPAGAEYAALPSPSSLND